MIRRPPRSTQSRSSAASDVYKRQVRAQLAIPPLRCTGTIHVAQGSRPLDGLLNLTDRFIAMTDVQIESGPYPQLTRTAEVVAVARSRATATTSAVRVSCG